MGKYVNPKDMTKEDFLAKHGKTSNLETILNADGFVVDDNRMFVVLIQNAMFSAALIVDSIRELDYMKEMLPNENRPFQVYTVNADELLDYLK